MSLKSKIEAVIYAAEEPVTLQQLAGLLGDEVQAELLALQSAQARLPMEDVQDGVGRQTLDAGTHDAGADIEPLVTDVSAVTEVRAGEHAVALDADVAYEPEMSRAEDVASDETGAAFDVQVAPAPSDADGSKRELREREKAVVQYLRGVCDALVREYAESDRGIEVREVASGFRMATKPEYHDAVRGFVKNQNPPLKLTLQALETLAVVAYKQPVTAAEISEIRGVDSAGVLGGLMARKLIATAGRKQVIGRPMLWKTTRDFLLRFGLKDVNELPSMEEFERMAGELAEQEDLPMEAPESIVERVNARGDAELIREVTTDAVETQADDTDEPSSDGEGVSNGSAEEETSLER